MIDYYINTTLYYMASFTFIVRDTFILDGNLDDYYSNGDRIHGPRLFGVAWVESDDYPHVRANKRYSLNDYDSVAYDNYRIQMPNRYKTSGRVDPIIHECVHFLQRNTVADEKNYIRYNGNNYNDYISQPQEYQAHIVQIAYIYDYQQEYLINKVDEQIINLICEQLKLIKESNDKKVGLELIKLCKINQLI